MEKKVFRLSFVAYIKALFGLVIFYLFLFSLIMPVVLLVRGKGDSIINALMDNIRTIPFLLANVCYLLFIIYVIIDRRSVKLIINDEGVYIDSGALPWEKGVYGVAWRYIESAYFRPSFFSWLTNSYTVSLERNRKDLTDFELDDVFRGKKAVKYINNYLYTLNESSNKL